MGARPVASDFLHSMRFHVVTVDQAASFVPTGRSEQMGEAGFNQCTTPEATVEAVEYKEGTYVYTRKYPGNPTMSDISLMRGVARSDSTFWDWLRIVIEGEGEYRSDVDIKHYHRNEFLQRNRPPNAGDDNFTSITTESVEPARVYHIKQAFPIRHKVAGDLDATSSEISIMELDLSYEFFEVEEV